MIKAVAFDYGGVLTTGGRPGSLQAMIHATFGIPIDDIDFVDLHDALRRGDITGDEFISRMAERHNVSVPARASDLWENADVFEPATEVYALATDLRQRGIRTAVFSNVYEPSAELIHAKGLYDGFDPVILSYVERAAKPEPAFFDALFRELGCAPAEILLVDDQIKNQRAAESQGMPFVLAESPKQIVHEVKQQLKHHNNLIMDVVA